MGFQGRLPRTDTSIQELASWIVYNRSPLKCSEQRVWPLRRKLLGLENRPWVLAFLSQKAAYDKGLLEADPSLVSRERRFPKSQTRGGLSGTGGAAAHSRLREWTGPHLTLRVCTPSPQLSGMFTKVTLQTLHGSETQRYWLQSLWQGTTSYTCNTHSSQ